MVQSKSSFIEFFRKSPDAREIIFSAGETVLKQGEPGHAVFVVLQGKLGVFRESNSSRDLLGSRGVGQLVGEMALFGQKRRAASVVALEQCLLLGLQGDEMLRLMLKEPALGIAVSRLLASRLQEVMDRELEEKNRQLQMSCLTLEADTIALRAILDQSSQAVIWLDASGKVHYRNSLAIEWFGQSTRLPAGLLKAVEAKSSSFEYKKQRFDLQIKSLSSGGCSLWVHASSQDIFSASMNKV